MLWVIEISKIFEKKTENTNKTEKFIKMFELSCDYTRSKIKYIVYRKTIEAILWKKYMKQLMQK